LHMTEIPYLCSTNFKNKIMIKTNDLKLTEEEFVNKYYLAGWFISKKAWRDEYRKLIVKDTLLST